MESYWGSWVLPVYRLTAILAGVYVVNKLIMLKLMDYIDARIDEKYEELLNLINTTHAPEPSATEDVKFEYVGTVNAIGQVVVTLEQEGKVKVGEKLYRLKEKGNE